LDYRYSNQLTERVLKEKVQHALLAEGIQLETFGGDVPSVEVSGLTGLGLDDLIETLSLMAEVQDLRAERDGPAYGHVLESKMHKGLGYVWKRCNIIH